MSTEIWKAVVGREGEYEVSSLGRVRSLDREAAYTGRWGGTVVRKLAGRELKPSKHTNGYLFFYLGRDQYYSAHRLVATAFVPGASDDLQVNHRNSNREDNRVGNLEWVTCGENHLHAHKKPGRKQHIWTRPVSLLKGNERLSFESVLAAAKHLGVGAGSVSSALRRNHKCQGYEVAA